ncbi:MAG: hypothetical protein ACLVMH_11640 [Christensenellales bacterium]
MPTLKWIERHCKTICISPDERVCANCVHFHLHYVQNTYRGGYEPTVYGHCANKRCKNRHAGDTCPEYVPKDRVYPVGVMLTEKRKENRHDPE